MSEAQRKTLGPWINLPAIGCVVYDEGDPAEAPGLVRAWISEVIDGLGLAEGEVKLVARIGARWRGFAWRAVDKAIGDPAVKALNLLVGTPVEVHLGVELALRSFRSALVPPYATSWLIAETERWPADRLAAIGRRWLTLAAMHGTPVSGGVFAATTLRNARMEASLAHESDDGELYTPAETLFRDRLHDQVYDASTKLRRLYPITLLGRRFASPENAELLRTAGARLVEPVGESLIVEANAPMVPAWSPEFLAATVELRRLLWPFSLQNPADAEGLGLGVRFEPNGKPFNPSPNVPDYDKHIKQVRALLARERKEFAALIAAAPPRPLVRGELVRPMPERERPPDEPLSELPKRKRKPQNLSDLF
jgi:hypothetical protein